MHLVFEGQLESVLKLSEVLSPQFDQFFAAIFGQYFSCGLFQGGWLQYHMRLKRLDNIAHSGHRNTKVSGDGHVALRLSMLGYNLLSDLLRQFSVFFPFVNTQCGSCSDTKQQNEGVAPFKLVG